MVAAVSSVDWQTVRWTALVVNAVQVCRQL